MISGQAALGWPIAFAVPVGAATGASAQGLWCDGCSRLTGGDSLVAGMAWIEGGMAGATATVRSKAGRRTAGRPQSRRNVLPKAGEIAARGSHSG